MGTLVRLKAHRKDLIDPKIAEHHGRIVKLMGDGALVEFASVVNSVTCAVAIQEGMAERRPVGTRCPRTRSPEPDRRRKVGSCTAAGPIYRCRMPVAATDSQLLVAVHHRIQPQFDITFSTQERMRAVLFVQTQPAHVQD